MSALLISGLSLVVALFSLWLSYRNRIERIESEKTSKIYMLNQILHDCSNKYLHAENSFREFWRLAYKHALLKVPDFDKIIDRFLYTREHIHLLQKKLSENKDKPNKIATIMEESHKIEANANSLMKSLQESLRILEREIGIHSELQDDKKNEKLRESISHIKQWSKF